MMSILAGVFLACGAAAAVGAPLDNPAIARAAARRGTAITTNRMARPVTVLMQRIDGAEVVSALSDGSTVRAPLKRATSAHVTPSGRDVLAAETRALVKRLGADPGDPRAAAAAIAKAERKAEKDRKNDPATVATLVGVSALAGAGVAAAIKSARDKDTR